MESAVQGMLLDVCAAGKRSWIGAYTIGGGDQKWETFLASFGIEDGGGWFGEDRAVGDGKRERIAWVASEGEKAKAYPGSLWLWRSRLKQSLSDTCLSKKRAACEAGLEGWCMTF